ncbi:MAG: DUF2927 domain-containing protein [Paracoccaceae bacterium]
MNIGRLRLGMVFGPLLLGACAAATGTGPGTGETTRNAPFELALPPIKTFAAGPATPTNRSNASIAIEFIELAFQLESGRSLPVLSRFEGPITLRLTGRPVDAVSERDLNMLIARLRDEAKIEITRVDADRDANITVQVVSRRDLQRFVPQAACFVAPNVQSWREFRARRRTAGSDWTELVQRKRMAIFLPGDVSAQEIRDCLHEEIAQAIGPVNDLYHLTDSIFNDDNFYTVLTGFDMMVLRAYYDDELQSGMSAEQVRARLPGILARINPTGRSTATAVAASQTPRAWSDAIQSAFGARASSFSRLNFAKRAVGIARNQGWYDNRLGFSLYAQGRLALAQDTELALRSFEQAQEIFAANPDTRLHAAHVAVQAAAYALSVGRPEEAIRIVDRNSPTALAAQNAVLLSTLLMIKAQALDVAGRSAAADIVRLDSLGWARYGIGSDAKIRFRLREIAALAPADKENSTP